MKGMRQRGQRAIVVMLAASLDPSTHITNRALA